MKDLLKDYETYLKIERSMSPNTVASYCSDVSGFLEYMSDDILSAESADVEEYAGRLEHLSKRSQARLLSSLRSFFDWLVIEGYLKDNPCDVVDYPKLGRYLPDVLSLPEIEDMISSVDLSSWQGLRDRAILEVLYGCGLRVSEAVALTRSSLYMDQGFVRVIGKGNKERLVPIGDIAAEAVKAYMEVRPAAADSRSDDVLFLNRYVLLVIHVPTAV